MVLSFLEKQARTSTTTTTRRPRRTQPPRRRVAPPSLKFLFGGSQPFSELVKQHQENVKRITEKDWSATTTVTPRPWTTPRPNKYAAGPKFANLRNTVGKPSGNLEFFGPKDFVPKSQHNLPIQPMRLKLKYTSAKEFPRHTYGRLVPMPR
jgi:hypothetical protein